MRVAVLCNDRVALPAIDQLLSARLLITAGMPDRVHSTQVIVRNKCSQHKVPFHLFTKKNFKEQILSWLDLYNPDVVLVKTFPFLIPDEAVSRPRHGFINFHYAPLPHWRGPNPLFWMIRNGQTNGGITIHRMNKDFDDGPVLIEQPVPLAPDINFGLYYTQLAYVASSLTGPLLQGLVQGTLIEKQQDASQAKWYSRPKPSDLFIDWNHMDAADIKALVKACNPWNNGAGTRWNGWPFGITYASVEDNEAAKTAIPGTILSIDTIHGFMIATKDGKAIKAEVVYCEEGFYPGHCMSLFGLKQNEKLS
jgi:methionyl-tRNA formyltransferase